MRKKHLVCIVILLIACNSKKELLKYQDSINKFYVQVQMSQNITSEDSLLTFYDFNNPFQVKEVGFYKDGFRNGLWTYNLSSGVKKITWAYYKNKDLNFETNLFEKIDTIKYGDSFTRFLFQTDMGEVLGIFINGSLKDSFPENNYRRLTEKEFSKLGIETLSFKTNKILYRPNNIYVSEIKARENSNNEVKFLKTAFSFIDKNNFIEFCVISSENNIYRSILFDAVLTNFVINGKRLYNPFQNDWQ